MARNIVIDTDPGIDDAVAIMASALNNDLNILGISVVAGNVDVDKATSNTLRILGFLEKKDIPVYKGAHRPLLGERIDASDIHGDDGLGNIDLKIPRDLKPMETSAPQFLINIAKEYPKDITLVTLGPLTNLAVAILMDSEFIDNINSIVSMAGAYGLTPYGKGNITPKAEFNVYTDPLAAKIVFSSETEKYLIGLDITQKPDALLNEDDMNMLRDSGKNGKLIHNMLKTLFYASGGAVPLHDPHTIIYLIKPEIYKFRRYFIDVEIYGENTYGEIVVDDREKVPEWLKQGFPSYICIDVDGEEFKKELFNTIL